MSIDPDDLKVERIKSNQKALEVQNYIEKQHALDKQNATGKMGHREVKIQGISDRIRTILSNVWNLLGNK